MASRLALLLSLACLLHHAACDLPTACTATPDILSCMFDLTDLTFLSTLPPDAKHAYTGISISLNDDIHVVHRNAFSNPIFNNVSTLTFDFNAIVTIEPDAFKGLNNLKGLMLNNNDIVGLKAKTLNGLENLNSVSFARNEISSIESETFKGLTNLKSLDLSNNRLTSVNKDIFQYTPSLFFLHLSGNQISAIEQNNFLGASFLFNLNLNDNQISQLHPQSFKGLDSLFYLRLGGNPIGSFDSHLFETTPDLRRLDISNSTFSNVPHINSSTVHIINLSKCSLSRLPVDFFSDLGSLQEINLSQNGIASFPRGLFRGLDLSKLDLDGNVMKTVGVETMEELYLQKNGGVRALNLTVTNNPWNCQHAGLKATIAWTKQMKVDVKFPCNVNEV